MKSLKGLSRASNGEFRIGIGYYSKPDGKRQYKQFRLGKNLFIAQQISKALEVAWAAETAIDSDGKKVWSQQSIDKALAFAEAPAIDQAQAPSQTAAQPAPTAKGLTLFQAFDLFENEQKDRFQAKEIGESHFASFGYRIKALKKHIPDMPIHKIDNETLKSFRRIITARPMADSYRPAQKLNDEGDPIPLPPRKPISIDTVKNWLMTLGLAFNYFASTKKVGWKPDDAFWRKNFVLTKKQQLAMLNGATKQRKSFILKDLIALYKTALPRDRIMMLMGLTLGWTQTEISNLKRSELIEINGEYFIRKSRGKTGVEGNWWVCPELAAWLVIIKKNGAENRDDLMFLTADDLPLVRVNHDSIAQRWDRLKEKMPPEVSQLPFKYLRKFAGQMVLNLGGGKEMVQLMLAHVQNDVASQYYLGLDIPIGMGETQFDRFHAIQRKIYLCLKPMFDAALPKTAAKMLSESCGAEGQQAA